MANYYESARTNYFLVKSIDEFKNEPVIDALLKNGSIQINTKEQGGKTYVTILATNDNGNGFPFDIYDEGTIDDYVEIDWEGIFANHLQDDSVAIIMGAGAEKLRYIHGYAIAFNNKGETKVLHLTDIYKLAQELGNDIQKAEY